MVQKQGFFGSLFDFSFTSNITVRFTGLIYSFSLIIGLIIWFAFVINGLAFDLISGLEILVASPLFIFLYVLFLRVILESLVSVVRAAENTSRITEQMKQARNEDCRV